MLKITKRGAANLDSTRILRKSYATAASSLRFAVCVSALVMFTGALTPAQQGSTTTKSERKLVTRVEPEYPAVLRARQIGGTVRLEVTITPKGTVKNVALIGGNPILAEAAISAVKRWTYAPGDAVSSAQVSVEFNPYR
jgi:TonB family protein